MDAYETAVYMLPQELKAEAQALSAETVEEIRLRLGRRPTALIGGSEYELSRTAVTEGHIQRVLERATGASIHSVAHAMAEGYISYRGLRIGLCGTAVMRGREMTGYQYFSSLNIRIPRECRGSCDGLMGEIYRGGFENTLLISRPGGGKTTALREIVRQISDRGTRVGVVDERNELSATDEARAQFDLGRCSDVLIGVAKAEGAMMLLRGMNPQVIAMDEITREQDIEAIGQVYGCGVGLLASAHARNTDELTRRPLYRELLALRAFRYIITITGTGRERKYAVERL